MDLLSPTEAKSTIATHTTAVASRATDRATLERVFDYLLAASIASWGVLGLAATPAPLTATRVAISMLHLTVALAIGTRAPVERIGSPRALLSSLPALIVAGLAFRLAAPLVQWAWFVEIPFLLGAALALWSFVSMGESFSVLPALRPIVSRGPYRFVRHPAYAGELAMIGACALSSGSAASWIVLATALPFTALRIRAEERLLEGSEAYRRYKSTVRKRVIPCLW